ncbi:MAG: dynamin family protein [Chloroflexota bacterium]|nr:MAG: hypothetical protein DLM70_00280 [Chloroflexota bacterium]
MIGEGYAGARRAGNAVAQSLLEIGTLIGEPGQVPVILHSGETVVPGLGLEEDAAALRARARDLRQGLFTVIVLGEFKNGKSTLLNGMLGSKTLPAKAAPATAIITILVHGDRQDVAVFETGGRGPRRMPWEEFVRDFQLSPLDQETIQEHRSLDRFAHVEYAQIECSHALCANGVKLIDSPGLGEHISRTRVSTNFLKRSQAVIMVLNATRILTRDERVFIESAFGKGRLHHVFFVINRVNQVAPDSGGEIRDWVRSQLEPHFRSSDEAFDQNLYDRRVFMVDAKAALDARSSVPNDEAKLEASGVPALEHELERFLTGEERVRAVVQSSVQSLGPVLQLAYSRIAQACSALDAPLEDLEQRRRSASRHLLALDGKKGETERTVLVYGEAITHKVFADLRSFVEEMRETWDEDSRVLMDLDHAVSARNVIASYMRPEARQRMAVAISEEVQHYLQAKFASWSDRIPAVIERDLTLLVTEVEAQLDDLNLELDRIGAAFAGVPRENSHQAGARVFRLALSLSDISGITEDVLAVGDMSAAVGRMVQQSIIIFLVRTLVDGGLLMGSMVLEVLQAGIGEGEVKKRIRRTLGERLSAAIDQQVTEKQEFVHRAIEERFQEFATSITGAIGKQIDQVRAEQDRILLRKRDQSFSIAEEKRRLDTIGRELRWLRDVLAGESSRLFVGTP